MKKISAEVIIDIIYNKHRAVTMRLTFPRFILTELLMYRRDFSIDDILDSILNKNTPFEDIIKMVEEDPFIPIAWQKDPEGRQKLEYITDEVDIHLNTIAWLRARDNAISNAMLMYHGEREGRDNGVTRDICNKLLEPFMWVTITVTSVEWDTFFEMYCPKYEYRGVYYKSKKDWLNVPKKHFTWNDISGKVAVLMDEFWQTINKSHADIHIQALAEVVWDAINNSNPEELKISNANS